MEVLDTNVIVRHLTQDHPEYETGKYQKFPRNMGYHQLNDRALLKDLHSDAP